MENLKIKYPDEDFTVLDFINAKSPVSIKCNKCGQIFNYKRGTSLYASSKKHICTLCNTKSVINMRNACEKNNISIIGMATNVTDKWKLKCNNCNLIFERAPSNWLKQDCPNCGLTKNCYTKQEWQEKVDKKFGVGEFEILNEKPSSSLFIIKHKCGFIRKTQSGAFFNSKGCPRCSGTMSKGERRIIEYLNKNNKNYRTQEKMGDTKQSFDFYLPELKIAIEYNGEQHYFPIETFGGEERFLQQQKYDENKVQYCKDNNIILKIISYKDYNNIETILDAFFKKFNDQSYDVREN